MTVGLLVGVQQSFKLRATGDTPSGAVRARFSGATGKGGDGRQPWARSLPWGGPEELAGASKPRRGGRAARPSSIRGRRDALPRRLRVLVLACLGAVTDQSEGRSTRRSPAGGGDWSVGCRGSTSGRSTKRSPTRRSSGSRAATDAGDGGGRAAGVGRAPVSGGFLDNLRFRAVCSHWRAAAAASPRSRALLDPRFHPRRWMLFPEGEGEVQRQRADGCSVVASSMTRRRQA